MCYFDGVGTKISEIAAPKWAQFADESGSWFGKGIWFYLKGSDFYDQVNPILLPFADEVVLNSFIFDFNFFEKNNNLLPFRTNLFFTIDNI